MQRSRRDNVPYNIWEKKGFLKSTPGNVIDNEFIMSDVVQASQDFRLMECGYDPWGATDMATKLLNDYGITMVEMRQGAQTLSEPAKDLLVNVMKGKIAHGGHPVLRWNADNVVMHTDSAGNIKPDKEHATEKIDGIVALIMAWGRAMFGADTTSVYSERGIRTL